MNFLFSTALVTLSHLCYFHQIGAHHARGEYLAL
nr:MAG TPA: hypothetical protein [Caudoviricetes sp.]